jgi:hypothetical protein
MKKKNPWAGTPAEDVYEDVSNPTPVKPPKNESSSGSGGSSGGNRSKNSGSSSSSKGKSSKTISGNEKQGGNGEKQGSSNGLTPPPGYDGPIPPKAPSIYDKDQPLAGKQPSNESSGISSSNTQKAIKDAPFSPIKKTKTNNLKKKQKDNDFVITQREYGELKALKNKLRTTGEQQKQWEPDPQAENYTIKDKDFDPTYLHGPGATKETSIDLKPKEEGVQLTPSQLNIYMENLGRRTLLITQNKTQFSRSMIKK